MTLLRICASISDKYKEEKRGFYEKTQKEVEDFCQHDIATNTICSRSWWCILLVVSSFKGMITDNLTNDSILKFVNERETDIEIPEEEPAVVFEEETQESVEENVEESTLESTVDYPETVELEKEEHISSELLDSDMNS